MRGEYTIRLRVESWTGRVEDERGKVIRGSGRRRLVAALTIGVGSWMAGAASGQTCGFGSELLAFVPRAGWPDGHQGFVRLVNTWDIEATVRFTATDDAGNAYELSVDVGADATVHFNSEDLEYGNPDKGGLSGTGAAAETGHWRLCFPLGAHGVAPTAYVRTMDGFLTDMTPSVHYAGTWDCQLGDKLCAEWHIPIFNPASNSNQVSRLRVINNTDVDLPLIISGIRGDGTVNHDEAGRALQVTGTMASGTVQDFMAVELETGEGLEEKLAPEVDADGSEIPLGMIGPARGKWRLRVRSKGLIDSGELVIVNLMATPTGHVTNLSADSVDAWARR